MRVGRIIGCMSLVSVNTYYTHSVLYACVCVCAVWVTVYNVIVWLIRAPIVRNKLLRCNRQLISFDLLRPVLCLLCIMFGANFRSIYTHERTTIEQF